MTYDARAEKKRGLVRERQLIEAFGWIPSSTHENIALDIDAHTKKGTSLSIKSLSAYTFSRSYSLAFELDVYDEGRDLWEPSWYYRGEAKKYIFDIENRGVYVVDKAELAQYVEQYGWDRETRLTARTAEGQRDMGHRHTQAKIGLVRLENLTRLGIAKRLVKPGERPTRPVKG